MIGIRNYLRYKSLKDWCCINIRYLDELEKEEVLSK